MKTTIHHRAFQNSYVGLISFLLSFVQTIISVPILLTHWGNQPYAVWLALFAGFSLIQTLDTGHINFVGNQINVLYHQDKEYLKKTLGSAFYIALTMGIIELIFVLFLVVFNQIQNFLGISVGALDILQIKIGLILLIFTWALFGSFGGILHRLLLPAGMLFQAQWWGILYRFLQFLAIILTVILGGNILAVCITYSFVQILIFSLTFLYIRKKLPEFYPWWRIREWKEGLQNFKKSLVLTTNGIAQQLGNNGLILFISNFLQTSLVPVFTTIRTLTNTALSITNVFISSLLPDIIRFHATGEEEKIIIAQNANWFITGVVVNSALLLILPFVENLYLFWTKGILHFNLALFLLLAASISFANFGAGLYQYLVGINHLISQTIITVVRVLIILICSFIFLDYGLVSLGIGILAAEIISSVWLPIFFVNNQLKNFNTCLDKKFIFISLLPPGIILFVTIYFITINKIQWEAVVISLFLLTALYLFNWSILDEQIKVRLADLKRNIFKMPNNRDSEK